jgi:hypothetical protein
MLRLDVSRRYIISINNNRGVRIGRLCHLQLACKPDFVRFCFLRKRLKPVSIIYLVTTSLPCSYDLPPGTERAVLIAGIHGLSTHKVYGS